MGISPAIVKLLMREGKREKYTGNVLTIGRQHVAVNTTRDLQKLAKEMEFKLNDITKLSIQNIKGENYTYITDAALFSSLGFDNIDSLDISDYEQCTVIQDLSVDIPDELRNKYDLIFDGGSSEHIFNLPKVFENYTKMLKVGGRLIQVLPSSHNEDHGFYMFSPTLLWDYYSANNWEIKDSLFLRMPIRLDYELSDVFSYTPGCLDSVATFDGFGKGAYYLFFVAKKTDKTIYNASVQQGRFTKIWKDAANLENIKVKANDRWQKKIYLLIPNRLKSSSSFLYYYIPSHIPLRFRLKLIGRY